MHCALVDVCQVVWFSFYVGAARTQIALVVQRRSAARIVDAAGLVSVGLSLAVCLCWLLAVQKNFVFPLPLFWYQFWTLGSGTTMYDSLLVTLFNTFFTSIPPFVVGISDKDVQDELLLRYPQAYAAFKRDNPLTVHGFVWLMLSGTYHSAVLYFLVFGIFDINDVISHTGRAENMVSSCTQHRHTPTRVDTHSTTDAQKERERLHRSRETALEGDPVPRLRVLLLLLLLLL